MRDHHEFEIAGSAILSALSYAEMFGEALFIVNRQARLMEANAHAEELLRTNPAFFRSAGRIALTHASRSTRLGRKIEVAIGVGQTFYMRIDDGCEHVALTAIILPCLIYEGDGHTHAMIKIASSAANMPYLSPLAETHKLTKRQIEFLAQFAEGMTMKQIAHAHGIRHQTVREAFSEMYRRLGVSDHIGLKGFLAQLPCV